MILYCPNIKTQSIHSSTPQVVLILSQFLKFNSFARCRGDSSHAIKHMERRETPLPQYLGVMIHTKTQIRELVDALFELGLCIYYDHVLNISTILGNNLCDQFEVEKIVCPPTKEKPLHHFSIDNVDHNPSSTTAQDSFHGTGISIFQHPQNEASGEEHSSISSLRSSPSLSRCNLSQLPQSYTDVPPHTFAKIIQYYLPKSKDLAM